uniref:Uncharacterized protein n=1 Tax=Oryza sativa subsp. japonica TaxID=39947 RepID=Q6ZCW9_ORYSJ|nr:hypothetical protein [Oryza sativa Japonica Group]BAD09403.1 hypothetical protein [Oryza sativa Japonica Group]
MEFGWALRRPMRLPDSPRQERGLPAALRGVGVKPEVWCAWLEGVMRRVLSRPLSGFVRAVEDACGVVFPLQFKSRLSSSYLSFFRCIYEFLGVTGGCSGWRQAPRQKGNQLVASGGGRGWEGAPVGSASGPGVLSLPSRRHHYEASYSAKEPRSESRKALVA